MSRGTYRGLFSVLFDHPDYQQLSPEARLVLLTARMCVQSGAAAIFRYYPEVLALQTGYDVQTVEKALVELESNPSPNDSWIVRDRAVLWVRNGLRHDPFVRLSDAKHRLSLTKSVSGLPPSTVSDRFVEYYGIKEIPKTLRRPIPESDLFPLRIPNTEAPTELEAPTSLTEGLARPSQPSRWILAETIRVALAKTRFADLAEQETFWRAQFRTRNGLDFAQEILKADAWCASHPDRAPRKNAKRFLNNWFDRAGDR